MSGEGRERAHVPVLLDEVVRVLSPREGETVVDATAGLGGHSIALGRALGARGTLVLNDTDATNLSEAEVRVRAALGPDGPRVATVRGNFAELPRVIAGMGIGADVLLADLGFASCQMDDAARGFSFMRDGPLDMRLDPSGPVTAADLVASMSERELAEMIRELGEDRAADRIARKLVQARAQTPISTTGRLAEVVRSACGGGGRSQGIDPATRTFQALRIAVNDELGALGALLTGIGEGLVAIGSGGWLRPGARVGVISFHSLEDRPVKRAVGKWAEMGLAEDLTPTPVMPGEAEVRSNPRSRSAKLRAVRGLVRAVGAMG